LAARALEVLNLGRAGFLRLDVSDAIFEEFAGADAQQEIRLTTPWSNGPIEGHINRLKAIKRQIYGRAGFELLKARVLPWDA
jgi:hypothetical protein